MTRATATSAARPALPVSVRDDFPFFRDNPLAFMDNAATTQKPQQVLDALTDYYTSANSNVGRGYYQLSMESTERYEGARAFVAAQLGSSDPDEVVFTGGTTESVNMLADTVGRERVGYGDRVLVTAMEHNSNLLPWRRLCENVGAELVTVPVTRAGRVDPGLFAAEAARGVAIAAVTQVSNVLGTVNPVAELSGAVHRHGGLMVVDGAQAVPHRPVDVSALGADFFCFSSHKVYGPMGAGVLWGRRELLERLQPYQVGGGTVKGVASDSPVCYVAEPGRLEAGTPDVAGAVGLAAGMRYLCGLGWDAVRNHDETLVRYAVDLLADVDRVRVVGDPAADPHGIVSFVVDGIHPYDVGGHLDRNGVAVRCGVHCASVFLDQLGLLGTVRLSFGVYNTLAEIEHVRDVLTTVRPGEWTDQHPTTRFL
jgi:cysteine desulfurase/selenocysteine lyase